MPTTSATGWTSRSSIETGRRRRPPAVPAGGRPVSALARDTAIVGIGQTEFSKHSGRSELQLAGEAVGGGGRRRRPQPRRHRRRGDLRHRRERRAVGHPLRGDPGAALHRADAGRRGWVVRHGAARLGRSRIGRGRCGGGLPRVQRALGAALRAAARREQPGAGDAAGLELVPPVRARHAGEGLRALVPALHAPVRRHQRGLRPVPGRGPQARRHQPRRVLLPAAAHARGAPGVAVDRRTDPAQARLLPGERRRRRHGGDEHGAGTRPPPTPGPRRRGHPGSPARRRRDVRLLRRRSRRPSPKRRGWGVSCTRPPVSRPTTSTWR